MKKQQRTHHRHSLHKTIHTFHLVSFANILQVHRSENPTRTYSVIHSSPGKWPGVAEPGQDKDGKSNPCLKRQILY